MPSYAIHLSDFARRWLRVLCASSFQIFWMRKNAVKLLDVGLRRCISMEWPWFQVSRGVACWWIGWFYGFGLWKKPALGGRYSANDPCWKAWSEVLQQLASCSLFNTFQNYSILFSTIHHCSLYWKQVDGCQPLQECRSVRVPWRTLPQPWEHIFHRVFMDTRHSKQHARHTFQRRFEMLWRSWCSK